MGNTSRMNKEKTSFRIRKNFPKKRLLSRLMRIPQTKLVTIAEETREQLLKDDLTNPELRKTFLSIGENSFRVSQKKTPHIPLINIISDGNDDEYS